ncbi:hypothetical protein I302_106644 [Kwoniella bestiolae CBS 10118]|uniref:SAP domain-containing protein n=1 Tax=Kwoniella bestiolae CBS 10118 TaxID=1296100 RepID=A0A1B9G0U1_9TREE|nr:hypothetical protein I302_06094 [Kwoniella bestiolae CBS 10118]OCF24633.1 hypothetical protein I302_06094 [Kwoniella bestiolae CBS 10118]
MLRRKLSAGLLRPTSVLPPTPAQVVTRPRSRSLASAVLLSSQRNWKTETVVTLKSELKKRGLSQQGNKATLISRLESSEQSSLLGPLPPFPNGARSLSTSASVAQPPKPKKDSTTGPGPATTEDPSVTTTGPQISSQRTEARKVDPIEPEKITVAPGLPKSDVAATRDVGEKLDVRFPGSQAEKEVEQVIPLTPDNFSAGVTTDSAPSLSAPKVLTVASASTHLEGGPVHGVHESHDAHSLETESAGPSLKDIPSLTDALTSLVGAPGRAWSSSGIKLPEINLPKSSKQEYKSEKRGLNDDERRGLYVLAGVLGLGLSLGGGKKDKKGKKGLKEKVENAVAGSGIPGARSVKGDAKWEKASGAGVVGHGSRKD